MPAFTPTLFLVLVNSQSLPNGVESSQPDLKLQRHYTLTMCCVILRTWAWNLNKVLGKKKKTTTEETVDGCSVASHLEFGS